MSDRWTPDQPLRADATDEQMEQRYAWCGYGAEARTAVFRELAAAAHAASPRASEPEELDPLVIVSECCDLVDRWGRQDRELADARAHLSNEDRHGEYLEDARILEERRIEARELLTSYRRPALGVPQEEGDK